MNNLLNSIPENVYPVVSDYLKVLIPSMATYLITKNSLIKPAKYEIRKLQFENIYLPLYLLTKQMMKPNIYVKNLPLYIKKVEKIIYKNYPLVFPKTLKLFEKVKYLEHTNRINSYHILNFEYQINSDYEKLKRELGYPTNSFLDFFKRLSLFNKISYSLLIIALVIVVYAAVSSFLLFLEGDMLNAASAAFIAIFIGFWIYLFSYPARH